MTRHYALLAVAAVLTACAHAKASPVAPEPPGQPPPAYVAPRADVAPKPFQALRAVQKAAPVIAAVAGEALASAPAVAVASATGGPLAGVLAFLANNRTLVEVVGGFLIAGLVWLLMKRGVLTPARAATIHSLLAPATQSPEVQAFVARTKTKADDIALEVAKKVDAEVAKIIGSSKPAEIALAKALIAQQPAGTTYSGIEPPKP